MISTFRRPVFAMLALVFSSAGFAADNKADSGKASQGDRKFMTEAAQGGMAEVRLGELAQKNGAREDVKQFGRRMATDHSKANDDLKSVASKMSVPLPKDMGKKHEADVSKMSKLTGAAFDSEYIKNMVADHEKDVGDFEKQANKADSPDLKQFAARTLPTLQEHLKMAHAMKDASGKK